MERTKRNLLFAGIVALIVLTAGCQTAANVSAAPLEGTEWILTELNGQPVISAEGLQVPTLKLDPATKRAAGTSGINRFSGNYQLDGAELKFGMLIGTRMGGSPEAMARETAFLSAMQKVSSWKSSANTLEISAGKTTLLKFSGR